MLYQCFGKQRMMEKFYFNSGRRKVTTAWKSRWDERFTIYIQKTYLVSSFYQVSRGVHIFYFSVSPTHASPAWLSLYPVVHSHRDPPIVLVQMPFSQNPGTSVHSLISGEKLIERWWENSGKVNDAKSKSMSRSNLSPYLCLCLCVCFCPHLYNRHKWHKRTNERTRTCLCQLRAWGMLCLRPRNTDSIFVQLVAQQRCVASWDSFLCVQYHLRAQQILLSQKVEKMSTFCSMKICCARRWYM